MMGGRKRRLFQKEMERNGIKTLGRNEQINKLDLTKQKKILVFESQSKKMRRQGTHWEETFAKHISDKVLLT